ncbi:unnamed protein product [Ectocarpus sp. 4 AP-2014]
MEVADGDGVVHRFNAELPYKERLPAENKHLLSEVKAALASFAVHGDVRRILQACSGLTRMRRLKYALDDTSRLLIAQSLYSLVFPAEGEGKPLPWQCSNKVMYALGSLLGQKQGRLSLAGRLVLPWRPMLAALKACALRGFPTGSNVAERSRMLALQHLLRQARRYWGPGADREIWDEFKEEIAQVHAQGAFKALYLFVAFMRSARSSLYDEVLPSWFSLWGQVDHCPAWDGAWLTLLCRARKYASASFDWTPYMADIYSSARASIHTPVSMGDAGSAPPTLSRRVAYQYSVFAPTAATSRGTKLKKLSKFMVFLLGKGGSAEVVKVSDVAIVPPAGEGIGGAQDGHEGGVQRTVSPGALNLISLFRGLRTYFHPSNGGRWSLEMGLMVNYVLKSLASRVGGENVLRELGHTPPPGELTQDDAGLVIDALLPLVLEMVYSKDPSVGSLSNMCLATLASLSPKTVAPAAAELVLRALDPVASINHTHQAPAAIRAMTCIFRPLMHPRPYLAPYLPAILELTLPGLDSSDVFKTSVTLQLYHLILCWIPVLGSPTSYSEGALDDWKPAPCSWLDSAEEGRTDGHEHLYEACEGLGGVMLEWSAAFLDRLFEVLRHKDKFSKLKPGDLASDTMGVANAMTRGGANGGMLSAFLGGGGTEAFLVSLIRLVTEQLFTMADEPAADMASAKVLRFVTDRSLPNVEKDVAGVVEMMASARPAKSVSVFFPALCDGLLAPSMISSSSPVLTPGVSSVLLRWRFQLLSGLARGAGAALAPHGPALRSLIAAGVSHKDKRVRKGARKLLRKALLGLCALKPADTRSLPPSRWANVHSVVEWRRLCEPLPAGEADTLWVEPSQEGLSLAAVLLGDFLERPMRELMTELESTRGAAEPDLPAGQAAVKASVWREHLKTMEYAFRGGVCLLGDRGTPGEDDEHDGSGDYLRDDVYLAVGGRVLSRLLAAEDGPRLYRTVAGLRAEVAGFMNAALEACAQEKGPADVKSAKLAVRLSQRIACTRGAKAHQARRQSSAIATFKSQQRDVLQDAARKMRFTLAVEAAAADGETSAASAGRRALEFAGTGGVQACPRAMVVARANVQHWKRLGVAPRSLAFAAKSAASSSTGVPNEAESSGGGSGGAGRAPWPAASAVLGRYRALFSSLMTLSSSEYAMVRAAAQVGVNNVGGVFPWFAREAVPGLISRLSLGDQPDGNNGAGGDAAHRRLTGACYLLHQNRSMRHVVSKLGLSRSLLLALCDSQSVLARLPTDKQEKAAARVTILFTTYVSYWGSNPLVTEDDRSEYDALLSGLLQRLAALNGSAPAAGGGWRYQLLASWCLMHLIRPTVQPPLVVWHYYSECLSTGGDGQPLQRLALGALKRLLAVFDPALPGAGDVSRLLSSKAFLHAFLPALAYNHQKQATEGGPTGGEQWSLGVKEILRDAGRGDTRELFPRLRFAARSPLFWARNASLVSAVVSAVGDEGRAGCIRILLEEATAAKAETAHEDKRSFDCAAAEVAAGVLAILAGPEGWNGGEEVLRDTVLPFVEITLEGVSLDGRLDWTDAIRFALDRSTPEGCEPLVSMVVERAKAVLQDGGKGRDDYSVLVAWLSFLGAVMIELSGRQASTERAASIAKEMCPLLIEGLDHPFKACREEIARNLFLCAHVTDSAWAAGMADEVRESILAEAATVEQVNYGDGEQGVASAISALSVEDEPDAEERADSALLASAMAMSDGTLTAKQEEAASRAAKHLSLRRETVLQWLHQTAGAGDHVRYLPILVALLPVALRCARDSNAEVAGMGRGTCLSSAAALAVRSPKGESPDDGPTTAGGVINAVLAACSSQSSWRVRRGAAAVACVLQTRLHFVLTDAQHGAVDATVVSLLGDDRREVQETARLALSTRVAHLTAKRARALCETFAAGADSAAASRKKRRRVAKRQAAAGGNGVAVTAGEPSGAMQEQQRNVLGLSAVVLAAPCDTPPWVPGALESLAKHVNDESPGRLPVRQTVTHTFKEFRRTHQDKWEESHKARFSRDQLDTFDDVLGGAHSYFI